MEEGILCSWTWGHMTKSFSADGQSLPVSLLGIPCHSLTICQHMGSLIWLSACQVVSVHLTNWHVMCTFVATVEVRFVHSWTNYLTCLHAHYVHTHSLAGLQYVMARVG